MDYEVKLEIFEGPLDLLLHLIHKNEVDIFDIPIAVITDQYLEYLDIMKALNINIAGDFFLMASTLIYIKSRMLLPESKEDEEEDPRMEITRPLLEYMRLKEMAEELSDREILDRDVFARQIPPDFHAQIGDEGPQLDVNLFQLMDAFKRIVDQKLPGIQLRIQLEEWSVKEKMELIMDCLNQKGAMFFNEIFSENKTISEFIATFLALLELVHIGLVNVFQPAPEMGIQLTPSFGDENGENGDGEVNVKKS